MASYLRALCLAIISLLMLPSFSSSSETGKIAVYWGQNADGGGLRDNCKRGINHIVMISFLNVFGRCQQPLLNLSAHCNANPPSNGCTYLGAEIKFCQSRGIKVFLSLGGPEGDYALSSPEDAKAVADYIWNHFLGGQTSGVRPLGDAILDGVDFDIENARSNQYWVTLALDLAQFSTSEKKVELSAAPPCVSTKYPLQTALRAGILDYVWVKFFNNTDCQYTTGNTKNLLASWNTWSSYLGCNSKLFMGLPAEGASPGGGYIPTEVLASEVLPYIMNSTNFGGVMLWGVGFSKDIRHDHVTNGVIAILKRTPY